MNDDEEVEMLCVACGDTGKNSKGNPCRPCQVHGRIPRRGDPPGDITQPVVQVPPMPKPQAPPNENDIHDAMGDF